MVATVKLFKIGFSGFKRIVFCIYRFPKIFTAAVEVYIGS